MTVDESFHALLLILAAVRSSRLQRRLAASVDVVDLEDGARRSAEVKVSYSEMLWVVTDRYKSWSFTPFRGGRIVRRTGEVEQMPRSRDGYLPPEIALFFPLSMPIWGGTPDDFRVVGAEVDGGGVRLAWSLLRPPLYRVCVR